MIIYTLDSPAIQHLCGADHRLSGLIARCGELRYHVDADPLASLAETIVGQMLSSKAAAAITARLRVLCGGILCAGAVLRLDIPALRGIGLSNTKAVSLFRLAELVRDIPDYLSGLHALPDDQIIKRITALYGLGPWSAKMFLIFVMDRLDVLPYEDGAFLQAYQKLYQTEDVKPAAISKRCAHWSPYASLAARYLYRALDEGLLEEAALGEKLG